MGLDLYADVEFYLAVFLKFGSQGNILEWVFGQPLVEEFVYRIVL